MDISSLLIGILIGAIGVLTTGFLRKAGEDLYYWIKGKINPEAMDKKLPQVVVNLQGNNSSNLKDFSPVEVDHTSNITFYDIEKAIDNAPPLQRDSIANNYVGVNVEWIAYLLSAYKSEEGKVSLRLSIDADYRGQAIVCKVSEEEYRELSILPEGAKIRVSGEIIEASSFEVRLSKVRLHILSNRKA
ncbi:MAG: hypothetical protein KAQ99_07620 [Candidatus Aureabacteria bacterium]|nr:hypothetical protein [Candidatus Auribacterota bacterium]